MPAHRQIVRRHSLRTRRRILGFTLVEMLVTIAITLLIVFGLVQMFQWIGQRVGDGRALIELNGTMRGAAMRLQKDLDGLTVPVRPWPELGSAEGYFEVVEGPQYDGITAPADTITGDLDDVIMFSAFAIGQPFVGQVLGQIVTFNGRPTIIWDQSDPFYNAAGPTYTTITSHAAEIIWWTRFNDTNGDGIRNNGEVQTLHRRVLLIRPDIDPRGNTQAVPAPVPLPVEFFNAFDLSARRPAIGTWITNSLSDLTQRENRFAHNPVFPHALNPAAMFVKSDITWATAPGLQSAQQGEDVMLSQVMSFDVRLYDPSAQQLQYNNQTVMPGDPGWTNAVNSGTGTYLGAGAYVDLNYSRTLSAAAQASLPTTDFSHSPHIKSQLQNLPTYDTWSWFYERDGLNQNGNGLIDEGTDGFDNDDANGTDDVGERETSPPYPVPLRGVKVTIRVYEPDTRQIRQQAVVAKFVPE